jgi:UDP-glucose 4-epimerase
VTKREIPVVKGPRRAGDPPVLVASAEKAARVLGWTAKRTSLDAIVRDAWEWHSRD